MWVKQLRPHLIHPRIVELFEKEITVVEQLGQHPQIPQLWAYFSEKQHLYIVQEFIQGYDLSQEILPTKQWSEEYVTKLLREVLEVLCFVHSHGVIHGDIKPRHLIRRYQDGKICLSDFATVKEIASLIVDAQGEFISSAVMGTPGYMPSEQKKGNLCLSSDIYALGITAIQALTGIKPSKFSQDLQTGEVIWQNQVEISKHLREAIAKMVSPHLSLRYPNAMTALQGLNSPSPSKTEWTRRTALKAVSFVSAGFAAAVLGHKILQPAATESAVSLFTTPNFGGKSSIATPRPGTHGESFLKTFEFQTVTVDQWGTIINHNSSQPGFLSKTWEKA